MLRILKENSFHPLAVFMFEIMLGFLAFFISNICNFNNYINLDITDILGLNSALAVTGLITVVIENIEYQKAMKQFFIILMGNSFVITFLPRVKLFSENWQLIVLVMFFSNIFVLYRVIFNKANKQKRENNQ